MAKPRKQLRRTRDRAEEILDYLFDDRNREIRRACKTIIRGASRGLAIYPELLEIDSLARKAGRASLPHTDFLNVQSFLWMLELEIACLLDDYIRSSNERRWLYARLLLLTLFESTKTLRRVFSIGYRRDLQEKLGPESAKEVSELHAYIHHAFEDLNRSCGEIRRGLVGHRDPDPAVRFKLLSSLSGIDIKDSAWELLEWCATFAQLQERYMLAIDKVSPRKG